MGQDEATYKENMANEREANKKKRMSEKETKSETNKERARGKSDARDTKAHDTITQAAKRLKTKEALAEKKAQETRHVSEQVKETASQVKGEQNNS